MTQLDQESRQQQTANGIATIFDVAFRVLSVPDMSILFDDVEQVSGFTVSNVGSSTTTVTFDVAPADSTVITFFRDTALEQNIDYQPNDPFPAETHERALDKLTMINQEQDDELARSLKFSVASPVSISGGLPLPVDEQSLIWDGTTGLIKNGPSAVEISASATEAATSASNSAASASAASTSETNAAASAVAAQTLPGRYLGIEVFDVPGIYTWVLPADVGAVEVTVIGGGASCSVLDGATGEVAIVNIGEASEFHFSTFLAIAGRPGNFGFPIGLPGHRDDPGFILRSEGGKGLFGDINITGGPGVESSGFEHPFNDTSSEFVRGMPGGSSSLGHSAQPNTTGSSNFGGPGSGGSSFNSSINTTNPNLSKIISGPAGGTAIKYVTRADGLTQRSNNVTVGAGGIVGTTSTNSVTGSASNNGGDGIVIIKKYS